MGQKHSLTVPGRYTEIRHLCEFVAAGARQAGLDEDASFEVQLACDEACTNIIEHTYGAEDKGQISVSWHIDTSAFIVTIQDNGRRFDPEDIPPPPVPPDPEDDFEIKVGGLGVYFMRKLMDRVIFSYDEGIGNVLTMAKQLPGKENK